MQTVLGLKNDLISITLLINLYSNSYSQFGSLSGHQDVVIQPGECVRQTIIISLSDICSRMTKVI